MLKNLKEKVDYLKENYFWPALSELEGKVLEIGFGEGENFNHYPSHCEIYALEKSDKEIQQLKDNNAMFKYTNVKFFKGKAESLPFEDNFFNAVIASLVLCSVDSTETALKEIERVLKPGGKFILLEHARSKNRIIGKLENIFSELHAWFFNNCHLNRDPLLLINKEGFEILAEKEVPYIFGRAVFIIIRKEKRS
jgi:ubiquinone/menaquinone biosynthesis C-methylase UbiE